MLERGLAFDRVADVYDRVRPGYPDRLLDAALGDRPIRDVLEVGCGSGQLTVDLIGRQLRVQAVDTGARLASIARRRAERWQAYWIDAGPDDRLAFWCPQCAEREFGTQERQPQLPL